MRNSFVFAQLTPKDIYLKWMLMIEASEIGLKWLSILPITLT